MAPVLQWQISGRKNVICDQKSNSLSLNENLRNNYRYSNALLHLFSIKIFVSSQIGVLQAALNPMKCDVINDVRFFLTVCRRINSLSQISNVSNLTYLIETVYLSTHNMCFG